MSLRPRSAASLPVVAVLLVLSACTAVREPALESRQVPEYPIEDFLGTTAYMGASFTSDGAAILASNDSTGVMNVYAVPAAGGDPKPLTRSTTESVLVAAAFPADGRFLYLSDQGGNELSHLFIQEIDGSTRDLTPGEKVKATFVGWAPDERSFFVLTNERDPRHFDLYEYTADGYGRTLLYRNEEGFDFGGISPDRRLVALRRNLTDTDSDIVLHDRQSGKARVLTAHQGEVFNDPQSFSRDAKSLYYLTDEASEFRYLVRMDLESGKRDVIEKPDWDVIEAGLSKNGKYLWLEVNNDARSEIRLYEAATMQPVRLPALPKAAITSVTFSRDETQAAFYVNGSRQPNDLYVLDLATGRSRPLTRSLSPRLKAEDLVEAETARFRSFDNTEVPGILYKPHRASASSKAPALVWVHGGPGGQSRVTYSGLIQYLVNHGYTVYAINNRGSSGYGRTFYKMDDRKHGEGDLDDCVASKKFLAATGYVDPARIGIIGGSYGGYMTLAALTFRPQEFAVGVDIFGVSNWVRTLQSIPPYWESFRKALYTELGDPSTDEAYLRKISPLFHASEIRKPLLVLQGANDPRVLKVESDEIVAAAKNSGVPVEYLVFEDEGHGFRKKENQNKGYRAIVEFLDVHLKGAKPKGPDGVTPATTAEAPAAAAPVAAPAAAPETGDAARK
ncbi:MAG TPA: S9 family peptidase [Candidatus Polarisedimenticolia bacterium]|nr:S9 family peptidase [Candidatus Polarisedimenticolia bacterium]